MSRIIAPILPYDFTACTGATLPLLYILYYTVTVEGEETLAGKDEGSSQSMDREHFNTYSRLFIKIIVAISPHNI
jgi:hypothetical protein